MPRIALVLLFALHLVGCGSSSSLESGSNDTTSPQPGADTQFEENDSGKLTQPDTDTVEEVVPVIDPDATQPPPTTIGGERPAKVILPTNWSNETKWPLVMLLHGYGATGVLQNGYLQVGKRVNEDGFILVLPDGTKNPDGKQFWNATAGCCNFHNSAVDDVGYLSALIDEAIKTYNIDPGRIYLLGHSNGGFMSYRLACELGQKITALVSLAGSTYLDAADCKITKPVGVLQVHGTADDTIPYAGWQTYPGAKETVNRWIARNGCTDASPVEEQLDLVPAVQGAETLLQTWSACKEGTRVGLWTIDGGSHIPFFNPEFMKRAIAFLMSHKR